MAKVLLFKETTKITSAVKRKLLFLQVHSSQPKNWFITLLWGPRGILNMADTGQQKPLPGAGYPALLRVMGRMSVSLSTAAQVSREEEELVQVS